MNLSFMCQFFSRGQYRRLYSESHSSSLSALTLLSSFSTRRDFLAGAPRRAIYEPERAVGSVFGFLGCYRAKVLSHTGA